MVSIFQAAIATVFAVAALSNHADAQGTVAPALAVGEYFRPSGSQVSGFPGATTPYRRSPCPMLNTLANHGYLPRNGQNVTRQMIKDAMVNVFNVGVGAADFLANQVPEVTTLDYLSTHNFIEHDASLVHYDSYLGKDPSFVDPVLLADFLGRANSQGRIGVKEVAAVRKERKQVCEKVNPPCNLGAKLDTLAFAESSFLLLAMGGDQGESISKAHAESFLLLEKIPADYKKPATDVSSLDILATTSKLKVLSVF